MKDEEEAERTLVLRDVAVLPKTVTLVEDGSASPGSYITGQALLETSQGR